MSAPRVVVDRCGCVSSAGWFRCCECSVGSSVAASTFGIGIRAADVAVCRAYAADRPGAAAVDSQLPQY